MQDKMTPLGWRSSKFDARTAGKDEVFRMGPVVSRMKGGPGMVVVRHGGGPHGRSPAWQ